MYGEMNFNPTLFVAQMKHVVLPLAIGTLIVLFAWATYHQHKEKKAKRHENHI